MKFRRWLASITRNKLVDHLSKHSNMERGSGDSNVHQWLNQQATEDSSASVWDWNEKRQVFAWAAERVKEQVADHTWQVFHRTAIMGQDAKSVATDLGIREGLVYVARSRVMSRLRKHVMAWSRKEAGEE